MSYVAWQSGRIVASAWYQPGEAWIEDVDRRFELAPDEYYAYDAWAVAELRGHRVNPWRASRPRPYESEAFGAGSASFARRIARVGALP